MDRTGKEIQVAIARSGGIFVQKSRNEGSPLQATAPRE
jgi:hypothetical protein